jgi:formylglycine-generating enzyme required for sulfatase activity
MKYAWLIAIGGAGCLGAVVHGKARDRASGGAPTEMIRISGGSFAFGPSSRSCSYENEEREVEVHHIDAFWIDRSEVTVGQYKKCVNDGVCSRPSDAAYREGTLRGSEDYPIVRIGWQDAAKYCRWAHKRLPTDMEWERAARGPNMSCYPWGDRKGGWQQISLHRCGDRSTGLRKVCTKPGGNTPEGLCDMVGNADEYVAGWWDMKARSLHEGDPAGADQEWVFRILRGGGPGSSLRGWDRRFEPASEVDKRPSSLVGFRCARDDVAEIEMPGRDAEVPARVWGQVDRISRYRTFCVTRERCGNGPQNDYAQSSTAT